MNVASLSLCRELYELSGWDDPDASNDATGSVTEAPVWVSRYTLGFILRKLPGCSITHLKNGSFRAKYNRYNPDMPTKNIRPFRQEADTPEDAAAKLAIELFKQGVLSHD
jgi:hypothetical protein